MMSHQKMASSHGPITQNIHSRKSTPPAGPVTAGGPNGACTDELLAYLASFAYIFPIHKKKNCNMGGPSVRTASLKVADIQP